MRQGKRGRLIETLKKWKECWRTLKRQKVVVRKLLETDYGRPGISANDQVSWS